MDMFFGGDDTQQDALAQLAEARRAKLWDSALSLIEMAKDESLSVEASHRVHNELVGSLGALLELETDAEMLSVLQEKYQKFNARLAELARERVSSGEPSRPLTPPSETVQLRHALAVNAPNWTASVGRPRLDAAAAERELLASARKFSELALAADEGGDAAAALQHYIAAADAFARSSKPADRNRARAFVQRAEEIREKAELQQREKDVGEREAQLEALKQSLEDDARRVQQEEAAVAERTARAAAAGQPSYWDGAVVVGADGFALVPIEQRSEVWTALEKLLRTDSAHLGIGRDVVHAGKYDRLKPVCCWRLQHPGLWRRYEAGLDQVRRDAAVVRRAGIAALRGRDRRPGLPVKTEGCGLPGVLDDDVCEQWLLHGTKKDNLLDILSNGTNERYSGGLFGNGTYLAEDAGKTDQYVGVDSKYDRSLPLHKRLYAEVRHPDSVFYVLVCRVALGHYVRTQGAARENPKSMDGAPHAVFAAPTNTRELVAVPSTQPPVHYHALVAECGKAIARFREFVVFHSEYVYPEYVVAYQRFMGRSGPVA